MRALEDKIRNDLGGFFSTSGLSLAVYYARNLIHGMEQYLEQLGLRREILQKESLLSALESDIPPFLDPYKILASRAKTNGILYMHSVADEIFSTKNEYAEDKIVYVDDAILNAMLNGYKRIVNLVFDLLIDNCDIPPEAIRFYRLRPKDPIVN